MGCWVSLCSADGFRPSAYRAEPDGPARGGVVLLHEVQGVNGHIRNVADRLAAEQFAIVAPALFDRVMTGVDLGYSPEYVERGRELAKSASREQMLDDVDAAIGALHGLDVAVMGFCLGGDLAYLAAVQLSGISASVCYYGGGIAALGKLTPKAPVLLHFGEHDRHIPVEAVEALHRAQPALDIHLYPAGHGFNCDERGSYDPASAQLAWKRSLDFLRQRLPSSGGRQATLAPH
ncbi:MAG: dienelactone hydrolase family protein [Steroidobacteraceae bacterium]